MTLIQRAADLTAVAFVGTKKTAEHSIKVFEFLKNRFGVEDEELLAAGMCHDLLEDTDVTELELEKSTSKHVAELVKEISHAKGASRAEKMELYRRLPLVSDEAKLVKLADYLANLEWNIEVIRSGQIEKFPFLRDSTDYMAALRVFLDSTRATFPDATLLVFETMLEVERFVRSEKKIVE